MYNLKTYKLLLWLALIVMLVFGIIIILDYTSKGSTDGWSGFAAMALVAILMLIRIRDIKKKKRE